MTQISGGWELNFEMYCQQPQSCDDSCNGREKDG